MLYQAELHPDIDEFYHKHGKIETTRGMIMAKRKLRKGIALKLALLAALFVVATLGTAFGLNYLFNRPQEEKKSEEPEVVATPTLTPEPVTTSASLFMVGDALLHTTIEADASNGDGTYTFSLLDRIGAIAQNYDLRYYNQETILGGDDLGIHGYPRFNGPQSWGDYMLSLGFNLVSTANNHCLDMNTYGLENSVNYWKSKEGILMNGTYTSQEDYDAIPVGEINGIRYAFLSFCHDMNGLQPEQPYYVSCYDGHEEEMLNKVAQAKTMADVVLVAMHWGDEYQTSPNEHQTTLAQQLADAGADIIIGNHPHCIEPVQWLNDGKTICFYALGNIVAAQYDLSKIEMMAALTINKTTYGDGRVEISLSDLKTDLMYCYFDANCRNFDVIPFPQMDDAHLANCMDVYEQYKAVVTQMDPSIPIGGF